MQSGVEVLLFMCPELFQEFRMTMSSDSALPQSTPHTGSQNPPWRVQRLGTSPFLCGTVLTEHMAERQEERPRAFDEMIRRTVTDDHNQQTWAPGSFAERRDQYKPRMSVENLS